MPIERVAAPSVSSSIAPSILPFAVRLRDLLATLESTVLLGAAEARVRGLGEHLRFACLAMPCSEALVALELEALGRLRIPVVANGDGYRVTEVDFLPSGTPFAYLLGGGGGHAAELSEDDPMVEAIRPCLAATPRSGVFVPIRLGEQVVGGAALLSHDAPLGDRELAMAERLGDVLALTVESFRTERVIFELFARALPDLIGDDSVTSLRAAVARHVHALRITPSYQRRLELAAALARVADKGEEESRLAVALLDTIGTYLGRHDGAAGEDYLGA